MSRIGNAEEYQGASVRLQNRLVLTDQSYLVPDDVEAWTVKAFEGSRLIKTLVDAEIDATENFFAELQTSNGWSRDAIGYNFEYVLAGDAFKTEGGHTYRIEFDARTADETVKWVWMYKVLPWHGVR